jgi:hypothetical protein
VWKSCAGSRSPYQTSSRHVVDAAPMFLGIVCPCSWS